MKRWSTRIIRLLATVLAGPLNVPENLEASLTREPCRWTCETSLSKWQLEIGLQKKEQYYERTFLLDHSHRSDRDRSPIRHAGPGISSEETGMRTLTTKKGMSIQTDLSDHQAMEGLKAVDSDFARDLLKKCEGRALSYDQMAWVHKLVIDNARPAETADIGDLAPILRLFATAREHLKFPKIRIAIDADTRIKLSIAGPRAKFPGTVNVTDDAPYGFAGWFGRIHDDGEFEISRRYRDDPNFLGRLVDLLRHFARDPAGVASAYGMLSGHCSFCSKELTDERSTEVGYGPVCAKKWHLPWGAKDNERMAS